MGKAREVWNGNEGFWEDRGGFDRPAGNIVMNPRFAVAFVDFKDIIDAEPLASSEIDFAFQSKKV